jgi:epoxyqueuosine reductase QueG
VKRNQQPASHLPGKEEDMDIDHTLFNTLRAVLAEAGASLVGCADLTDLPDWTRSGLPVGVSIGLALDPAAVAQVPERATMAYYNTYQQANQRLDELALLAADYLTRQGVKAIALTMRLVSEQRESQEADRPSGRAWLPHKTVATRAGLGWMGKNNLLITPQYGSAIRFATVLTDAPLPARNEPSPCLCGDCRICADACPGDAIKNQTWTLQTDRDDLFDPEACRTAIEKRGQALGIKNGACGICIAVCPYTRPYLERL